MLDSRKVGWLPELIYWKFASSAMKKQITATLSEMLRTVHMHHLLIFYFSHMFVDVDRNFNFFSSSRLISSFWKTNENKTDVVQTTKAYFRRWHWSLQTHKTGFSGWKLQFRCISNYCVFFILFYFMLNEEKKKATSIKVVKSSTNSPLYWCLVAGSSIHIRLAKTSITKQEEPFLSQLCSKDI